MHNFYTDGGCDNAGTREGSFGWFNLDTKQGDAQYFENTTSNIMEMTAVIEVLKTIPEGEEVHIYSDSEYTIKGITDWILGWKKRGWRASGGGAVKNQALWKEMDALCAARKVFFHKVKGHAGIVGNEIADSLTVAARAQKRNLTLAEVQEVAERVVTDYE